MGFEKLLEKLDIDARNSVSAEKAYHDYPHEHKEEYYSLPFVDHETDHELILSEFFEKAEKLADKNPKKDEILGILNGYKNKISAYERLYCREYCKMAEQKDKDFQAFENKFQPPNQKALRSYLVHSPKIKKQMAEFDKAEVSKLVENEKLEGKNPLKQKILPAWLRGMGRFKGNTKSEKVVEKEFEPER